MTQMQDFFTRQKANDGVRFPLALPDGTATEHWLLVAGLDSDRYRALKAEQDRALLMQMREAGADDSKKEAVRAAADDAYLDRISILVTGWSFEQSCTPENVREFLQNAPHIRDAIDAVVSDRSLFYKLASKSSTPTPPQSSSSTNETANQS